MTTNIKVEGYWWSKHEPQYPVPVPNVLTVEQAKQIYNLIKRKERSARHIQYRGWSTSRVDKKTHVGSGEYLTEKWIWPAGFAEHYVLLHRVKPSDEFLNFIGYREKVDSDEYASEK